MKTLLNKLSKKYQNAEEHYFLLIKHNLDEIINSAIEKIDLKLIENKSTSLAPLSGIILTDINKVISEISDKDEKMKIEYILADIFQEYINDISSQENSNVIVSDIINNLKTACEYGDYNYNDLTNFLGLEKAKILKKKSIIKNRYYDWIRSEGEFDEICRDLYDKKIIYSIKEFKKLFKPITDSFYVKFNSEFKDEVIILFQIFKEERFIKPRGTSGHFAPLLDHAVDNENNFLIQKAINKEHERIKKNSIRLSGIKEKLYFILNQNLIKK